MAIKGGRKHKKRVASPRSWPVLRKTGTYITKTKPGRHNFESSISLATALKEILNLARTTLGAKKIIKEGKIKVNGKIVKESKSPVGFMDVVNVIPMKKNYRVSLTSKGKIQLSEIPEKNSNFTLSKISNKKIIKNNKVQLNFEDGSNITVDKDKYKTGDVLKLQIPDMKIIDHFKMEKGNTASITKGKHAGQTGKIEEVLPGQENRAPQIILRAGKNNFRTLKKYVFITGKDKTVLSIGENK